MDKTKYIKLNNGLQMPRLGFGTWQLKPNKVVEAVKLAIDMGYENNTRFPIHKPSKPNEVVEAVKQAIDAGYRYIDCAWLYLNEHEVGEAIRAKIADGTVKREELFIVSKIWSTSHSAQDVRPALQKSLDLLNLDYIDLYLIHWPIAFKAGSEPFPRDEEGKLIYVDTPYMETWTELEKAYDEGLIKSIGLSNFNSKQIQEVMDKSRIKPANLQIEVHPYMTQQDLVKYCHDRNISVVAYSPFGSPERPWKEPKPQPLLEHDVINKIGKKYNKSAAQVILKWLIQRDIIPIPKSVTPSRIKANYDVFDFELTSQDMSDINALNKDLRLITYGDGDKDLVPSAPFYPFNEPF